jgi:hypothetical protein
MVHARQAILTYLEATSVPSSIVRVPDLGWLPVIRTQVQHETINPSTFSNVDIAPPRIVRVRVGIAHDKVRPDVFGSPARDVDRRGVGSRFAVVAVVVVVVVVVAVVVPSAATKALPVNGENRDILHASPQRPTEPSPVHAFLHSLSGLCLPSPLRNVLPHRHSLPFSSPPSL